MKERSPYSRTPWDAFEYKLRYNHGLSVEDYARLELIQDRRCAGCRNSISRGAHVDHDHVSGRVRGLLCSKCNRGIGYLGDSPELLERLAVYLRQSGLEKS